MAKKQSKIASKPKFKVRKKANLRLSPQKNKISNYFTAGLTKIGRRGRGVINIESETSLGDLDLKFSSSQTSGQPGPRT